jgi:hypothetical protein
MESIKSTIIACELWWSIPSEQFRQNEYRGSIEEVHRARIELGGEQFWSGYIDAHHLPPKLGTSRVAHPAE